MEIKNLYPGYFASNCYLLISGSHAAVVDPSAAAPTIFDAIREAGATLDMILLTHGHFDHILSVDELRKMTGAPVYLHEGDRDFPADSFKNAFSTFFEGKTRVFGEADRLLRDGDVLTLGEEMIRVIHTPGHTGGSVCYLCNNQFLVTGDTVFDGGFGRTDLIGGNSSALYASFGKLRALPQSLPIYPGHGTSSTLGYALDCLF